MSYRPEPKFAHDRVRHVGVLLVNIGTPDAATPASVRRYLAEFLADPRVVEIPRVAWRPILHGVILRTRPAKSAARYAAIWTKDGSPLAVHTNKQKVLVSGYVGQRLKTLGLPADHAVVEHGMRYGEPSPFKYRLLVSHRNCHTSFNTLIAEQMGHVQPQHGPVRGLPVRSIPPHLTSLFPMRKFRGLRQPRWSVVLWTRRRASAM